MGLRSESLLFILLLALPLIAQQPPAPSSSPTPTPTPSPIKIESAAPDVPLPDPGTLPTQKPKAKSVTQKVGRKLKEAAPRCLDFVLHSCWAQPSATGPEYAATPMAAKDLEVGDFYFKKKNYLGAELRYRHALESDPNTPEAMFKLALARERLGNNDDARCTYLTFLGMGTDLPFTSEAKAGVQRLKRNDTREQTCNLWPSENK